MRTLLDQGAPRRLRLLLPGRQVETAFFNGWFELSNRALLRAAEQAGFEVLIAGDKGLRDQQNFTKRQISVFVLSTLRWPDVQNGASPIQSALVDLGPGVVLGVEPS